MASTGNQKNKGDIFIVRRVRTSGDSGGARTRYLQRDRLADQPVFPRSHTGGFKDDRKPAKVAVRYRGTLRVPLNTRPLGRLTHTRTVCLTAIPHSILYGAGDRTQPFQKFDERGDLGNNV